MNHKASLILVLLAAALACISAQNADASASPNAVSSMEAPAKSPFGLTTGLQISSDLNEFANAERKTETEFLVAPSYQISEALNLGGKIALSKNLQQERESQVSDTKLTLTHGAVPLNPFLKLSPALAVTVATNQMSRERDSLIAAFHLQPALALDLDRFGLKDFSMGYKLSLTRNLHEYETSREGKSNTKYSLSNNFELGYAFSEKLDISATFSRAFGMTYQNGFKNNFSTSQTLTYATSEQLSFSIGHENEGAAFKENGQDSNFAVFNPNASTLFGAISFNL